LSSVFAAELEIDERLRRQVIAFSIIATLVGAMFIVLMPIGLASRMLLLLAFLCYCRIDIRRQLAGYARVSGLYIDAAGAVRATGPAGDPLFLELDSGSVVLQRIAWLRLRFPDGKRYGELLIGDPDGGAQWHALQLIWEQQRQAFGRTG